ncbi:MAG: hypothetical protein DRG83_00020 [Deltaproteobacteria bacterium]|nr:MAG: hypothetical protein DRG83_00020 [Deltaproteobacteria bacterium]
MPGVSRSFAGPVRLSDLLALEEIRGTIPTTDELIDIALNWVTPFSLITRPQLLSFMSKELIPALQKASRPPYFIDRVKAILEELPEKIYEPVSEIATPASFPEKYSKLFGRNLEDIEWNLRHLRKVRGSAIRPLGKVSPFLIALNPELMRSTTPVHEMLHYWAALEHLPLGVQNLLLETHMDIPASQLALHEALTSTALSSPSEYGAEFITRFLTASTPREEAFWARQIEELPPVYRDWIKEIINRIFR